jgi:Fur family peroxide stress response transcriptional regulator
MAHRHDHTLVTGESPIGPSEARGTDIRLTPQRRVVYDVLLEKRDHPTATEVFLRVKERMPSISLATVYNCLETLTQAGLVRQVNLDRSPSRYCPNLKEHAHFHCEACGEIFDVELDPQAPARVLGELPPGFVLHKVDVALRGHCPACNATAKA